MSHYTRERELVAYLRHGEDALERLGGLLPLEIARIRDDDDYSPITRRLEPAFTIGQRCVVTERVIRAQVIRDARGRPTGEFIPRQVRPTMTVTIRSVLRTSKGAWSIPFHVDDQRDPVRRVRRLPPALAVDAATTEVTAGEVAAARLESSYCSGAIQAVDDAEAVDDPTLARFAAEAVAIEDVVGRRAHAQDAADRRSRTPLEKDFADALAEAERAGVDTTSVRFITERQIAKLRGRLERAA